MSNALSKTAILNWYMHGIPDAYYAKHHNFFVRYMNHCPNAITSAMLFTPSMKDACGIDFTGTEDTNFIKEWKAKPEYIRWLKTVLLGKMK